MRQGPKWERASISPPVGLASLWLIFYIEAPCLLFLTFSASQDSCFPVVLHWWKLGEIALCRRMFCPQCSPTRISETISLLSLPWPPLTGNFFFLFSLGTAEEKGLFSSLKPQSQDQCVSCSNLWSYKSKGLVRPSHTEGQDLTPTQRKCCVSSQLEPSQRLKRTKTLTNKLPFWLRALFTAPKTASVTWEILSKYCRNLHLVNWVSSLCQALWQGMAIQKQESTGDPHFREE